MVKRQIYYFGHFCSLFVFFYCITVGRKIWPNFWKAKRKLWQKSVIRPKIGQKRSPMGWKYETELVMRPKNFMTASNHRAEKIRVEISSRWAKCTFVCARHFGPLGHSVVLFFSISLFTNYEKKHCLMPYNLFGHILFRPILVSHFRPYFSSRLWLSVI